MLLRNAYLSTIAFSLSLIAASSQAAITLFQSPGVGLDDGLVSYNLIAMSTAGETIIGVSDPVITPGAPGMGLHQVWTPVINSPTPTRQEQLDASVLWSDTWLPYDSYWRFSATNSLSLGGAFTETNNATGGASLTSTGFGPPITGFGSMSFTLGDATKFYTVDSGLQGPVVNFAQLVMKEGERVLVDVTVQSDGIGIYPPFEDFCVGVCPPEIPPVVVDTYLFGITGDQFTHTFAVSQGSPVTWSDFALLSYTPNYGARPDATGPAIPPAFDPLTGQFTWNSAGSPIGDYVWGVDATNFNGTDQGLLHIGLFAPEPSTASLFALATLATIGCRRRPTPPSGLP